MKQSVMSIAALWVLLLSGCLMRPYIRPIQQAIADGDMVTVKALVEQGVNINGKDNRGRTPLYYASWYGRPEITTYLLSQGADPTKGAGWKGNNNALHSAANDGHVEVARMLIAHGMDVNCRNDAKRTPLMIASQNCFPEMVRLLISQGADVDAQDAAGSTALTQYPTPNSPSPMSKAYREVIAILLEAGSDIDHVNQGLTALSIACDLRNPEVVELLLKGGANPDLGKWGEARLSPLDYAVQEGYSEIVELLHQYGSQMDRNAEPSPGPYPSKAADGLSGNGDGRRWRRGREIE